MALSNRDVGYSITAYLEEGVGYGATATIAADRSIGYGITAHVMSEVFSRRRVLGTVEVGDRFPNSFYGIQEINEANIVLANHDRKLNFLNAEDPRGKSFLVRRLILDADTEETVDNTVIYAGKINNFEVGREEVPLSAQSFDSSVLLTPLPKLRVYHTDQTPPTGVSPLDLTVNFAEATDLNVPINILFGRATVPCAYVHRDENAKFYDYLVGEGDIEVHKVYKFLNGSYQEAFNFRGVAAAAGSDSLTLQETDFNGQGNSFSGVAFYSGLYIAIVSGPGQGQERGISAVDANSFTVTLDEPWDEVPDETSTYEIRTWKHLRMSPYFGRTAIRFREAQKTNEALDAVYADATRYGIPRVNMVPYSEDFTRRPDMENINGWRETLIFNSHDPNDTLEFETGRPDPLGGNNATKISMSDEPGGATTRFRQFIRMPRASRDWVFSFWGRADSPITITFRVTMGTASVSTTANLTSTWTRFTRVLSLSNVSRNFFVGWDINFVQGGSFEIFGVQGEISTASTPSTYEATAAHGQLLWYNFADAIKEVLSNHIWGLGVPIIASSFDTAATLLKNENLRCNGAIPSLSGESRSANDILNQLLLVRGMRLLNDNGAWRLEVDQAKNAVATFGTGSTHYDNIASLGSIATVRTDASIKKLRVNYGLSIKPDTGEAHYPFKLEFTKRTDFGQELLYELEYVNDHLTADKIGQYLANRNLFNEKSLPITVGSLGHGIRAGDVIELYAPEIEVENWLLHSENGMTTPWSGSNRVWDPTILHPDALAYGATKLTAGGTSVQAISGLTCEQDWVFFRAWVRGQAVTTVQTTIASNSNNTQSFTVGPEWQEIVQAREMRNTDVNPVTVTLTNTGGTTIWWTQAQVCKKYDRPYIRTGAAGITAQSLWQVVETSLNGHESTNLSLVPYSPSIFSHVTSDFAQANADRPGINPAYTPPSPPTNLVVPPDPPATTELAGIEWSAPYSSSVNGTGDLRGSAYGGERQLNSWAIVSFLMPRENVVRVGVQVRKTNQGIYEVTQHPIQVYWQEVATVDITEVGFGNRASVRINGLVPGLRYEVRCISYNSNGLTGAPPETSHRVFVARGDEEAPSAPDAAVMEQRTGNLVEINVTINRFPEDYNNIRLYKDYLSDIDLITNGIVEPTWETDKYGNPRTSTAPLIDISDKLQFHDGDVQPNYKYFYWVRTADFTGLLSRPVPVTWRGGLGIIVKELEIPNIRAVSLQIGTSTDSIVNGSLAGGTSPWTLNSGGSAQLGFESVGITTTFSATPTDTRSIEIKLRNSDSVFLINPDEPNGIWAANQILSTFIQPNAGYAISVKSYFNKAAFDHIGVEPQGAFTHGALIYWLTSQATPILDGLGQPLSTYIPLKPPHVFGDAYNRWLSETVTFQSPNNANIAQAWFFLTVGGLYRGNQWRIYYDDITLNKFGILLRDMDGGTGVSASIVSRLMVRDPATGNIIGVVPIHAL